MATPSGFEPGITRLSFDSGDSQPQIYEIIARIARIARGWARGHSKTGGSSPHVQRLVCGQSVDKNWVYFTEKGEDMELRARVERLVGSTGVDDEEGKRLVGEEALVWMNGKGFSLLLGLASAQATIAGGSMVGPHKHVASVEVRLR